MALLKSLIQRLLDSRTTPEEAAHSAMPNSWIHMTVGDETTTTFIAPSDGYVFQHVGGGSGGVTTYSLINDTHLGIQSQCNSSNGNASRVFLPCRKGDKILCERQGSPKTDVKITFFATAGGVLLLKNALLQGGGLCLNSLSSSLRRSFCRVRERGFNTQLVRPWMQRPSALQPTVIGTRLHPAWTVMSHTLETPQALFWKSLVVAQVSLILNRSQDGILFRYRKVKNLVISFQQIHQFRICTLSLCEEKTNSAVGGASC